MLTVGELLRRARIGKKLTLEGAEKSTRIRLKFLEALEDNAFEKLPPGTFARGFVKNYAKFLGISPDEALAFYRRQVLEERAKVIPDSAVERFGNRFHLTPQFFTGISIGILLLLFFSYLLYSYFRFAGSPSLTVNQPANNSIVSEEQIEVAGKSDPDSTLTINDQPVSIDNEGNFKIMVPMEAGLNTLTVVATNKFNRKSTVIRNVRLEK